MPPPLAGLMVFLLNELAGIPESALLPCVLKCDRITSIREGSCGTNAGARKWYADRAMVSPHLAHPRQSAAEYDLPASAGQGTRHEVPSDTSSPRNKNCLSDGSHAHAPSSRGSISRM